MNINALETMCQDKKARAEYLSREMALHDEATRIEEAMEEGKAEERISVAKEMLMDNEPIEKIMKYSKLSKEEIMKIKL